MPFNLKLCSSNREKNFNAAHLFTFHTYQMDKPIQACCEVQWIEMQARARISLNNNLIEIIYSDTIEKSSVRSNPNWKEPQI